MIEDKDELQVSNELMKILKPKLFLPVWTTVICFGPPLNLLFDHFIVGDSKNSNIAIIITIIAMTWLTLIWYWYFKERKEFQKYEKKIPMAIHYLFSQEKSSIEDKLIKLNDITDIISRKELLKKIKNIFDNIEGYLGGF
jgi:hypothetical protein